MTAFVPSAGPLDYAQIFDARGRAYHAAMTRWPRARDEEFEWAVMLAAPQAGHVVADFPSGGGYLAPYLPDVQLVLIETSKVFLECSQVAPAADRRLMSDHRLPLDDRSVDRIVSLAGLHHVSDKSALFREFARVLRSGGRVMIADVAAGSRVGRFLNEFVHKHSEEGHDGIFLDERTPDDLRKAGLAVRSTQRLAYPWRFSQANDMIDYCRLLFGITRATQDEIAKALDDYLGVRRVVRGDFVEWQLNWELMFVIAEV